MSFNSDNLAEKLLPLIQEVQEPLMITITTQEQCLVLGNESMKKMDSLQKAATYLHINSVLVEELAEYEEEEDDSQPYL